MQNGDPSIPEVTETDYLDADLGPPEDTDVYYQGTPQPGERINFAPQEKRASTPQSTRLSRPTKTEMSLSTRSSFVRLLAGILVLGFTGLLASIALVIFLSTRQPQLSNSTTSTPDTTTENEEGTWEGLKVKKGLR